MTGPVGVPNMDEVLQAAVAAEQPNTLTFGLPAPGAVGGLMNVGVVGHGDPYVRILWGTADSLTVIDIPTRGGDGLTNPAEDIGLQIVAAARQARAGLIVPS